MLRRHPTRRSAPRLEVLEDRTLPATMDVGLLTISADTFSPASGGQLVATGNVTAGLKTAVIADFTPLVSLSGTVELDQGAATLTVDGAITASISGTPIPLWAGSRSFDAVGIVNDGLSLAGGKSVTVAGVNFTLDEIQLADPNGGSLADSQVQLQGSIDLSEIGVTLSVDGANQVIIDSHGVSLTGVDATFNGSLNVAGVSFDASNLSVNYNTTSDSFQITGGATLAFGNNDSATANFTGNGLVITAGSVSSLSMNLSGNLAVGGIDFGIDNVAVNYDPIGKVYSVPTGSATFTLGSNTVSASFVDGGLVIDDGVFSSFGLALTTNLTFADVQLTTNQLTVTYTDATSTYLITGSASLTLPGQSLSVNFGGDGTTGLEIVNNVLTKLDFSLDAEFNLKALSVDAEGLTFEYSKADDTFGITGTIKVPELFKAKVTLGSNGQKGLTIANGDFSLGAFTLSLSDVPLGAFTIEQLVVTYGSDAEVEQRAALFRSLGLDPGDTSDFSVTAVVDIPGNWQVDAMLAFVDGELDDIMLGFQAVGTNPGLLVGDTNLYVTQISAEVQNLDTPENLVVSGSITVQFGESFMIGKDSVHLFEATGSFTVDRDELLLGANVLVGAIDDGSGNAALGSGTGNVTLDWAAGQYSLSLSANLLDVFSADVDLDFDSSGDVSFLATATVQVPDGVPFIGGDTLGGFGFYFRHTAADHLTLLAGWIDILDLTQVGFEYLADSGGKHFKLIGANTIDSFTASNSNTAQQYTYSMTYSSIPAEATTATLGVDWSQPVQGVTLSNPTVTITPANGSAISNFTPSVNGMTLLHDPRLGPPNQSAQVQIVGGNSDPYKTLPQTQYTITLTVTAGAVDPFPNGPKFTGTHFVPLPTVDSITVPANPLQDFPVSLSGRMDEDLLNSGTPTIDVFVAQANAPTQTAHLVAAKVPVTPTGQASYWQASALVPIEDLFPTSYVVFAVVNDGRNAPVQSAPSGQFQYNPAVSGFVENQNKQGLGGWTVYLDYNSNGQFDVNEPLTRTQSNGYYNFLKYPFGPNGPSVPVTTDTQVNPFQVGLFLLSDNYVPQNSPQTVTYDGTDTTPGNFTVFEKSAIKGTVFLDNPSSTQPGLGGWTVFLDANNNGVLDAGERTSISGPDGNFDFGGMQPGTYQLGLLPELGYFQSFPTSGGYTVTIDNTGFDVVEHINFGVQYLTTIGGTLNGYTLDNGQFIPSPQPLVGWTVQLLQGGQVIETTTSGADGSYLFHGIKPGNYTVNQVVPAGWRQVDPFHSDLQFSLNTIFEHAVVQQVIMADMDHDGRTDLVVLLPGLNQVQVFYGAGDGTFPFPSIVSNVSFDDPQFLVVGSFGGPYLDVAVINAEGQVDVLQNPGTRTPFTLLADYVDAPFGTVQGLTKGDFNNDGMDDLVIQEDVGITVFLTNSNPADRLKYGLPLLFAGGVAAADYDGDGNLDLVVNGPTLGNDITVAYGNGTGLYFNVVSVPGGPNPRGGPLAVADLTGDGHYDIVTSDLTTDGILSVYYYGFMQNPNLLASMSTAPGGYPVPIMVLQDLNGDLKPDLAVLLQGDQGLGFEVYLNHGGPEYLGNPIYLFGVNQTFQAASLAVGDLNGDGLLDVIVVGQNAGSYVFMNQSQVQVGLPVTAVPNTNATGVDFNNVQLGQVTGVVFEDRNRNALQDAGEPGRQARVYLDLNRNGRLDTGEPVTATTANGAYAFTGLARGSYRVGLVPEDGMLQTAPESGFREVTVGGAGPVAPSDFGVTARLLTPVDPQTVAVGERLTVPITATATTDGRLWFELESAPAGAEIDSRTGQVTWQPQAGQGPGTYSVTVRVRDLFTPTRTEAVTFPVTVRGSQPVFTGSTPVSNPSGQLPHVLTTIRRLRRLIRHMAQPSQDHAILRSLVARLNRLLVRGRSSL